MGVCCPTNREAKDRKNLEDAQGEQPEEPAPRLVILFSALLLSRLKDSHAFKLIHRKKNRKLLFRLHFCERTRKRYHPKSVRKSEPP